ncbi:cyclic di-GMP phosphodiesterase Gmr [mine drainage metagenome]|uniref:Cyclic di-GMP phosphodiesterase Gmr n=1 Tax=mine drainage metagenome TaxID=410659 RepID=A0A1J5QVX4_9ZZZZ
MRILLVEDNPGDARLLELMLQDALPEHQLVPATSLAQALEIARAQAVDIILLDLSLPDSHGIQSFWRMHDAVPATPIVVMTGLDDEALGAELVQAGAQDFMVKGSVDARLLLRAMRYAIERKRAELKLRQSEAKIRALLEGIPDLLLFLDRDGNFIEYKAARDFPALFEPEHFLGKSLQEVMPSEIVSHAMSCLEKTIRNGEASSFEYQLTLPEGVSDYEARFIRGSEEEALCIVRDISDRKRTEQRLHVLAHFDALTGLPNRLMFNDSLRRAQAQANRTDDTMAVLFIDLDRFKGINDTLGHLVGDKLLQQVGARFSTCVRETDTLARLGGDEFAIILTNIREEEDATLVAQKILNSLHLPIEVEEHEIYISASIGITFYHPGQDNRDSLLEKADVAMYNAKEQGRNNFKLYSSDMDDVAFGKLTLENQLRHALERQEFVLYYQPQVAAEGTSITAVEALLRWQHPERGLTSPAEFIPLLEESGLIIPVGRWVMQTACRQARQWLDAGLPVRVAVNLSVRQFKHDGIVDEIAETLADSGLPPELLEIELTESMFIDSGASNIRRLEQIKALGVLIAIDDFGSGASSLSYLKDFPIDTIKICQSFVLNLAYNREDQAIASAVLNLAQGLNMSSVAEGVETSAQADFLRAGRCDYIQGFLYSKPLPAEELERLLRHGGSLAQSPESPASPTSP